MGSGSSNSRPSTAAQGRPNTASQGRLNTAAYGQPNTAALGPQRGRPTSSYYGQPLLPQNGLSRQLASNSQRTPLDMSTWDEKRSLVLTRILSAEEFLGRMEETDSSIRAWCNTYRNPNSPVNYSVNEAELKQHVGLRGHLQDELLRIEAMLAEDDPTLQCLREFESTYPRVVQHLITLRERGKRIDQGQATDLVATDASVQLEFPSSVSTGTDAQSFGQRSDGQVQADINSQMMVNNTNMQREETLNDVEIEEKLRKRHKMEEEQVSDKYAKQLAYQRGESLTEEVNDVLDKHALHMQALRRRQQQERELLEAKLRDKRAERLLKLRAQRDGEEDENSKTNERPKSAAKPAPVLPAIISSIEFVKKNGKNGSTDSLSNTSNSSSSGEMANKHSSQTQSGESGFITGPHSDSEDSDTDGDASDNELKRASNGKAGMRQTLKDELWTRLKRKVTPEEFEQIMKTYREEERSITRMETEREKELQKQMKAKREAFVQAVLSKGDNLSDEEFARLMKNYTNDVNDLNARLEEDRKKWKNQLREKLEKLASSNNKNGLGVDNSNSRPASARSLSGRNDGEGEPKEVREAWLAEEEKLQSELKKLDEKLQDKLKKKRKDGSDLDEEELREILAKYEADRKRLEDVRAAEKAKISAKLAKKLADKQNGNASNKLQDMNDTPIESDADLYSAIMQLKDKGALDKENLAAALQTYLDNRKEMKRTRRRAMRDTQAEMNQAADLIKQHLQQNDRLNDMRNKQKALDEEKLRQKLQLKAQKNNNFV